MCRLRFQSFQNNSCHPSGTANHCQRGSWYSESGSNQRRRGGNKCAGLHAPPMKAVLFYHRLLLPLILLFALSESGFSKPPHQSPTPPCWCGKRIAVITLLYDDEVSSRSDIAGMLIRRLGQAGVPVVAESEDADWILIPTIGKIVEASSISTESSRDEIASALKISPAISSRANSCAALSQAGLLLTLYKASDWEALTSGGKIPTPLWMGYHEKIASSKSSDACLLLVDQVVSDLFNWNGGQPLTLQR